MAQAHNVFEVHLHPLRYRTTVRSAAQRGGTLRRRGGVRWGMAALHKGMAPRGRGRSAPPRRRRICRGPRLAGTLPCHPAGSIAAGDRHRCAAARSPFRAAPLRLHAAVRRRRGVPQKGAGPLLRLLRRRPRLGTAAPRRPGCPWPRFEHRHAAQAGLRAVFDAMASAAHCPGHSGPAAPQHAVGLVVLPSHSGAPPPDS
jgi:hypothetical protein